MAPPKGRNRASRLQDIQQILGQRLLFCRLRALRDKLCFAGTDVIAENHLRAEGRFHVNPGHRDAWTADFTAMVRSMLRDFRQAMICSPKGALLCERRVDLTVKTFRSGELHAFRFLCERGFAHSAWPVHVGSRYLSQKSQKKTKTVGQGSARARRHSSKPRQNSAMLKQSREDQSSTGRWAFTTSLAQVCLKFCASLSRRSHVASTWPAGAHCARSGSKRSFPGCLTGLH